MGRGDREEARGVKHGAPARGAHSKLWVPWVLGALVAGANVLQAAPARAASPNYEAFYDQFGALRPDSSKVATVASLELARDAGIIVLEQGQLALCRPVAGRVCAALFQGHGVFAYTPPNAVERGQIERFYGVKTLRRAFTSAVFIFGDSTLAELTDALAFGPGTMSDDARKLLRATVRSLTYEKERDVELSIARPLLEGGTGGLFFGAFDTPGIDPIAFAITPAYAEPVVLLRPAGEEREGLLKPIRLEVVCQSRLEDDTTADTFYYERPTAAITRYTMDCTITGKPAFSAHASIDLESLEDGLRWLALGLDDTLRVRSAEWGDGHAAAFRKGEGSPTLWVECDPPLGRGEQRTLRLSYDGPVVQRELDGFHFRSLEAATGWYPWQESGRAATFDLTFHVAKPIQFVCVGERVSAETHDRVTTSHWVTATPVHRASFNLGFFKEYEVKDPRIPAVTVLMSSRGHRELTDSLAAQGEAPGRDMEKQVASDVANSLLFYQHRFGTAGMPRFYATETLASHGEAFPGLIHLSTRTFHSPSFGSWDAMFRAHEVAHQWWGVGLRYATYHDQWLSEAFAEYSALSYVQFTDRNDKRYFDQLAKWREEILGNRKFLLIPGQQAGPIWLGWRTSTSTTPGDYGLIIYEKGAWVLHMLRNLMLDLDTRNEERFNGLMREFYETYRGREASTEDFRALAEQHAGQDLGWFFDQWVYGTDVPSYRFAWKSARGTDGKWNVRCRVEQRGVPDTFRMPVPIQVEFGGDKFTKTRAWIQGSVSEFDLPPLPLEPKKVTFNDMSSVLCEVANVKW